MKVTCTRCGATNNFPADSQGKRVVCGRCKAALPLPGTVIEPEPGEPFALLESKGLPVLVEFYSPTCAPCHMMHPVVEALAQRRAGDLMVIRINTDQHPQLAAAFEIQAVPTFVIVKNGQIRDRAAGAMQETDFSLWVASRM